MVTIPSEITVVLKTMAKIPLALVIPQFSAMHFNLEKYGSASPTSNHAVPCFSRLGVLMLRKNTANHQEMAAVNGRGKKDGK